ncbi:PD40 domain-containing protein [bacterium]|nr:PD40 domain-containing protein [bacterium]
MDNVPATYHTISRDINLENFRFQKLIKKSISILYILLFVSSAFSQGTRLLRQPSISSSHIVFAYGADLWISNLETREVQRLTSTPAVESDPHFSPDGNLIAFTSNRSGVKAVYTIPIEGGTPTRLTWFPVSSRARGWTPDGKRVLYASTRETAPTAFDRLWTVSVSGGPSTLVTSQWGTNGAYGPRGDNIVIDRISRWDKEWRNYRGGQNTSLTVLNIKDLSETLIPNERTIDIQPTWMGGYVYFISDRDWISNIWSFSTKTGALKQITKFKGSDIKWLSSGDNKLVFERDGYLHLFNLQSGKSRQLSITVQGDFPWAEPQWEDVSKKVTSVSVSPTGKRALMEARGEIFTIPFEHGDARNITRSSDAADRAPIWSPKGGKIAWFSDAGQKDYKLYIASQDGLSSPLSISIGESKMAWDPAWSPDGKYIAFIDDDVRIRIVDIDTEKIFTADTGGANLERGSSVLSWSPDSRWLAYSKTGSNNFRRIMIWSQETKFVKAITNSFADAFAPSFDRNGKNLYFLASTDVALASGWANTSSMKADPSYGAYVINLCKDDHSPFKYRSDDEDESTDNAHNKEIHTAEEKKEVKKSDDKEDNIVKIDFEGIERRILALPMPVRNYKYMVSGPEGSVFIAEQLHNSRNSIIHKFSLEKRKAEDFIQNTKRISVSADGKKILFQQGQAWKIADTAAPVKNGGKKLSIKLNMKLNRFAEWRQIFEEAWRYERDYFYDPDMHGRNWKGVYDRYAPLIPFVRHRADLSYIIDQLNGELSVGHSFVYGGDLPEVAKSTVGLLGADLVVENKVWKIQRIYTTESWNPGLKGPLDQPGMKVKAGDYLVGVNGYELTYKDDPYSFLDGTADCQTIIHINDTPDFKDSWQIVVKPIGSDNALRQRTWVEDNRRLVDKLSNGRLAYVWIPNTSTPGIVSFDRYFFAQQHKEGAVIDERFNGGGLLDDYMVDLMTRTLRAGLTNEVPNGKSFQLPAGILGPKVLLINELAGSGGDYFPWAFRQQKVGPLIGMRTWGGLVKSSVHYRLVDGGALTAPDNAVFDPINNKWVAENVGVPADIVVRQDAKSLSEGRDVQLERAVKEALALIEKKGKIVVKRPEFSKPAKQ